LGLVTGSTFEQIRVPLAVLLLAIAFILFWPRATSEQPQLALAEPSSSIVVGEAGGIVLAAPTPTPAPPTPTAEPTPEPTPTPAPPTPEPPDTFTASVLACRDISGSRCHGELDSLPRRSNEFTALVTFEDARAGDTINVAFTGEGVRIDGGPFTLSGGGDGYYYSRITFGDLPRGEFTLTATRNGEPVASLILRRGGFR
jgi:hypothetical protein